MTVPNNLPLLQPSASPSMEKHYHQAHCQYLPTPTPSNHSITTMYANLLYDRDISAEKAKWYNKIRPPYLTLAISLIQIGLYTFATTPPLIEALLFNPQRQYEAWRFVSYMLLHQDVVHLGVNVFLQCLFGAYVETYQARWQVACVYAGSGIGGALGAAAIRPDHVVGASAGVYGLLLSCLSHIFINYKEVTYRIYKILAIIVTIACDIAYCIYHQVYVAPPEISAGAHLFGALHGLLIGLILYGGGSSEHRYHYRALSAMLALLVLIGALVTFDCMQTYARR